MAATFEPDELEWDRAPRLSASLIDFIQTDGGARFLDLDYREIFNPEYTNLTNPAGARNQYMALSHDDFAAVRLAYETENPNIIAHMESALEVIGELYPDFKLDADDVIAQIQNNAEPEVDVSAPDPDLAEELEAFTKEDLDHVSADEANIRASDYFIGFADDIASGNISVAQQISGFDVTTLIQNYRNMITDGDVSPADILGTFTANDFAGVRKIAALDDSATNDAFIALVVFIDNLRPGAADVLANASDSYGSILESQRVRRLDTFIDNNIAAIESGELDPADYIGNLADYIDQGIYSKQFIQQSFGHDDFKFTEFLRGLDSDDVNSALDSLFEKLWDDNSPELSAANDTSIDVLPTMPSIDEPPAVVSTPEMPSLSDAPINEGDEIIPDQDEVTANPPPPPPPPGAAALQGLLQPNISTSPVLTLNEALALTREIEERLKNLPEDNGAMQVELRDIANDLQEIAIALTPNVAGDPRFVTLPPTPADPNNFDQALSELIGGVGAAANQVSHAELTELLIQNSQQASIVVRSIDYIDPPEIVEENAPVSVLDGPDVDVSPSVETAPIAELDVAPDASVVDVPPIDYSNINRPDSIDPNNAATFGISNGVIADPSDVPIEAPAETAEEPAEEPAVEALPETPEVSVDDPDAAPADAAPETSSAKITVYLETDMSVEDVQEMLSSEGLSQFNSDVWMSNTAGSPNRLWIGQPDGDMPIETARELAQALADVGLSPQIMVDGEIIDEEFVSTVQSPEVSNADIAPSEIMRPQPRPADLFAENADSAVGVVTEQPLVRPQPRPHSVAQPSPADQGTRTRLSELLDGRGYHNDSDGYTDYDAMQDAFTRSGELGITTEHVESIRLALNSPNFILQTSAAIEALNAYNTGMESGSEANALSAFFNTLAPEDFVPDLENSIDDRSVYDRGERDATHDRTVHVENNILPKL